MVGSSYKIFYISVMSPTGDKIFEHIFDTKFDLSIIPDITKLALNFTDTLNIDLSSLSYQNYKIYFKKGNNFVVILLTHNKIETDPFVKKFLDFLNREEYSEQISKNAKMRTEIKGKAFINAIKKQMYNLNFVSSVREIKKLKDSVYRF